MRTGSPAPVTVGWSQPVKEPARTLAPTARLLHTGPEPAIGGDDVDVASLVDLPTDLVDDRVVA